MALRSKTTFGFILACGLILLSILSSNLSTSQIIKSTQSTVSTFEIRSQVEKLLTQFMTAQNNIRGYHMTEQQYYLDRYRLAKTELLETMAKLRSLTKENEVQQKHMDQLASLMGEKVARWDQSFAIRKTGGFKTIQARLMSSDSKNQDAALFEIIDALKKEEDRLFSSHIHDIQARKQTTRQVVSFGGLLACLLIGTAAFIVQRDHRRREMAEDNIDRFFTLSLDLLCIAGMDGFFKRLSPSFQDVLGYSLQELYTHPIFDFIHPDDIARSESEIQNQMKGNKVVSFEHRFRCKDGSYKILSWKSVPVNHLMFAVARDITQQKEFEKDLMEAREEAQSAAIAKSSFLARMSHEIRTPLNGVVGMTDLLARTQLNSEQKTFLSAIRNSSAILLKTVNEVLDFSKLEAGRVQLEKIDFDLVHLVEGRIRLIGFLAHEKGLRIETFIDTAIPRFLRGDSAKIGQILLNLLTNAIKFTEHGKIIVRVELVSLTTEQCILKICIQDSGIGLTSEQTARLFQPFVQADKSTARKYGGSGLGLSICKRSVEIMEGAIGADSLLGQGSTFWFTVPLEISKAQLLPTEQTDPFRPVQALDSAQLERRKKVRVLIAENNHMNQTIVMTMMSILGYSAELAQNGREAVQLATESDFDLILMDQYMPVLDGMEASIQIRNLDEPKGRKKTPIVAFTATVIQEEQQPHFRTYMDDFILKPVTLETLESILTKWT